MTPEDRETLRHIAGEMHDCPMCECHAEALERIAVERTCGTFRHWLQTWPGINPTRGVCRNLASMAASGTSETRADDGCLKGWAPKEGA